MLSTVYSQNGCSRLQLWTTNHVSQRFLQDALAPYGSKEFFSVNILNMTDVFVNIQSNFPDLSDILYAKRHLIAELTTNIEKDSAVGAAHSRRRQRKQTLYSDMIRVLVLAAYGGVYFDTDVLLLRNLQPLLSRDFYYRWSNKPYANTAVFHLHRGSSNAAKLVEQGLQTRYFWQFDTVNRLCRAFHPKYVHRTIEQHHGNVELLPSAYMDPHWVCFDMRLDRVNDHTERVYGLRDWYSMFAAQDAETTVESFFPGAFAYHWHSQYRRSIGRNSVAAVFLRRYEEIRASGRFFA
jgi:hypothetical protein